MLNKIENINNTIIALLSLLSFILCVIYFFYKIYILNYDNRVAKGRIVFSKHQPIIEISNGNKSILFNKNVYHNVIIIETKEGELIIQLDNIMR